MRIPRIYYPNSITTNSTLTLQEPAANHVARVLRLQLGAPIILFNGHGGEYAATIINSSKHEVTASVGQYYDVNRESPLALHLGQGIARGEKMDYIIQKAVELGVQEITPLFTERCEVKLTDERGKKRLEHWRGIIISACEQSGRTRIPDIHEPCELTTWISKKNDMFKLMFHPTANVSLTTLEKPVTSVQILIGPEGGLSEREFELAQQQGFTPVLLGPRILRTETAAIAALCALQCRWGDLV